MVEVGLQDGQYSCKKVVCRKNEAKMGFCSLSVSWQSPPPSISVFLE